RSRGGTSRPVLPRTCPVTLLRTGRSTRRRLRNGTHFTAGPMLIGDTITKMEFWPGIVTQLPPLTRLDSTQLGPSLDNGLNHEHPQLGSHPCVSLFLRKWRSPSTFLFLPAPVLGAAVRRGMCWWC